MKRRNFLTAAAVPAMLGQRNATQPQSQSRQQQIHPGIWHFTLGEPEEISPVRTRHYQPASNGLAKLPEIPECPVSVRGERCQGGYLVSIPLAANQIVYGLGLQLQSFIQRGLKKKLRVNADPKMDSGDSHAPVPFYVTTGGYGVLVDTARYATFYCGNKKLKGTQMSAGPAQESAPDQTALPAAYRRYNFGEPSHVLVHVPQAAGIDVYVFGGPTMRLAVQRYNLFAGGGPLPPRWGLGVWYRAKGDFNQQQTLELAREFRARNMPVDVIGLEPGWQTHAYSCTYVWDKKFPEPAAMLAQLASEHFRVNLWEHCFTNPASPIYQALYPQSCDYEVWGGIVPDFLLPEARKTFADFHEKEHVSIGVSGYKLDECDNSDFTGNWSFPEVSTFPSGADGEQMHSLLGLRYQETIQSIFEKRRTRTYGLVRSSQALAAPYPYVLYSDLYEHQVFIRGLVNAGFSGLLWTPELRDAVSAEDLLRRLQSTVLSPLALINAWYIKNPPWKQVDRQKNNADELDPGWEELERRCRGVLELRMQLVPYLHAAFVRYRDEGTPPFRALVLDYPDDRRTLTVDDQYLCGEHLLVVPLLAGQTSRSVYLPSGQWVDFWTNQQHTGNRSITVTPPINQIPLFVKAPCILPLAKPTTHTADPESWGLSARIYGDQPQPVTLYEDNGSWDPPLRSVVLAWNPRERSGMAQGTSSGAGPHYRVVEWKQIELKSSA